MELPNYFIADLPSHHAMTPKLVLEACETLKRNREQYLLPRSTSSIVQIIEAVAQEWLEPSNPFRALALRRAVDEIGFSPLTVSRGLDMFFQGFTRENLNALILQDLGTLDRLDQFSAHRFSATLGLARGPGLLVHIAGGNIPNPTVFSLVLGLLTRSAQFMKCSDGTSLLPRLFAHSIYEVEPKLASCIEIAEWQGGSEAIEAPLFNEADIVTATGSDETLAAIRRKMPEHVRFVGYGHRVSFGYITAEALNRFELKRTLAAVVHDVIAWNQLGCLSPHCFYVEPGSVTAERFAELLAHQLDTVEAVEPRGAVTTEEAAAIATQRGVYEIRAAAADGTRMWTSEGSTAWTVIYDADPRFHLSCLNRFVYIKPAADLTEALQSADSVRGRVSTVGLAASGDRATALAMQLARWGVTRICPAGRMQNPPLTWRHDGRPALGDLVTWTDWEE